MTPFSVSFYVFFSCMYDEMKGETFELKL